MKRILSLLLIFALMVTVVSSAFSVLAIGNVSEELKSEIISSDVSAGYKYISVDNIGYYSYPNNLPMYSAKGTAVSHANRAKGAPVILEDEGVSTSTALQFGTTEFAFEKYPMSFRFVDDTIVPRNNTYTVKFDVKPVSGKINGLYAGIFIAHPQLANADEYDAGYISETVYTSDNLTAGVWQTVEYTAAITRTGRYVYINLNASEEGAVILIDNIEVYNTNDPDKTNLLTAENIKVSNTVAYTGGAEFPGTFDKEVVTRSYSPATQTGLYMGNNSTEYTTDSLTVWKLGGGSYSTAVKETMMPEIVNYKGHNYTNALKVGYSGGGLSRYLLQFRYTDTYRTEFLAGTSYTVEMKVKKLSGTLGNLYAGHGVYLPTGYISPDTYTDSDISSTEYTTLTFDYVAVNPSTGENCGGRWVYINFTSADESGVELLIDDINIYATDDATKTNMFTSEKIMVNNVTGSKDYTGGTKLLGTFDKEEYTQYTDNIPDEGIGYSYDHRIANNSYGEVGQKIANTNASVTTEGNDPKFTALGEGVKGSYAMEIGGSNAMSNYIVTFAATKVTANTKVRVEADIQLVSGNVTTLDFGILASQTQEKAFHSVDVSKLSDRWMTFSGTQTTVTNINTGTWVYFQFVLTAPEGGAILRVDNIKVYADGDKEKTPVFNRPSDFNFDFDIASFTPIIKDSSESYYSSSLTPSGEWMYDVTLDEETVPTTGGAKLVCMENAHSGDYAMAIGYDDEKALTNYRARFGLREVLPGKRYRVSLALAISGNSFGNFSVSLSSAIGISDTAEVLVRGNGTYGDDSVLRFMPREWTEVSFDFYEGGTMYDRGSWSYLIFTLSDYSYGVGDSALFIDTVSINEIDEEGNIIGPNIFVDGNFEYIPNTFDWESYESPYWSDGGATDFTFMNSIEKEIGAYACTVEDGMDLFEGMLTKEPYKYFDTYLVGGNKRDVMIYEATRLTEAGKKVWLGLNNILRITEDDGNRTFIKNWQEKILAAANELQIICGDQFQGFYFDEPGYYMTDAEYIEVTKWLRETFKKRVWSIHYKGTINSTPHKVTEKTNSDGTVEKVYSGSKLMITKDTHKYTTDVGYWRYGIWDDGATNTLNAFKAFCTGDDPVINKDTRKWVVPLTGRHAYYYQTSEQVVEIMTNMYEGMSEIPNFGGVAFYSMAYDNTTVTVKVDANGGDPVLTAIANGVLKCVDTENVIENEDGTRTYSFLVYGGYYMLDPNDPDHVPGHDLVRTKVDDIIADFAAYNKLLAGENMIIDNTIVVNNAGTTVANLLDSMDISGVAYVKSGSTKLIDGSIVKNGNTLYFTNNDGETKTYTIVKRHDLNSDGKVDAADIVRGKKVVAGKKTASSYEKMAATALRNGDIKAVHISELRNKFMG